MDTITHVYAEAIAYTKTDGYTYANLCAPDPCATNSHQYQKPVWWVMMI